MSKENSPPGDVREKTTSLRATFRKAYSDPKYQILPSYPLFDSHPTGNGTTLSKIGHFRYVGLFLLVLRLSCCNVWLQAFVEVHQALDRNGNSGDEKHNRDGRKSGQRLCGHLIHCGFGTVPNADQFEEEICKTEEVEDLRRSKLGLDRNPLCCTYYDQNHS